MNHPNLNRRSVLVSWAAGVALLGSLGVAALPSDKEQDIDITAQGSMRIDTANETATYTKDVVLTQGSLKINSDQLSAHGNANNWRKMIATGSPARLQQQPSADEAIVTVRGERIEYLIPEEKVLIVGNAKFQQGGTTIEASQLYYDVTNSYVEADAGGDSINVVIPPQQKQNGEAATPSDNDDTP